MDRNRSSLQAPIDHGDPPLESLLPLRSAGEPELVSRCFTNSPPYIARLRSAWQSSGFNEHFLVVECSAMFFTPLCCEALLFTLLHPFFLLHNRAGAPVWPHGHRSWRRGPLGKGAFRTSRYRVEERAATADTVRIKAVSSASVVVEMWERGCG